MGDFGHHTLQGVVGSDRTHGGKINFFNRPVKPFRFTSDL